MGLLDLFRKKKKTLSDLEKAVQPYILTAFPGGPQQIEDEGKRLFSFLDGRLTAEEATALNTRTKILLLISRDKSPERIAPSILIGSNGKLTREEAEKVYYFLIGGEPLSVSGGNGVSQEDAVIINVRSNIVGVHAEYDYIAKIHGKQHVDWKREFQMALTKDGRNYDVLTILTKDGQRSSYWFDITAFYGKT